VAEELASEEHRERRDIRRVTDSGELMIEASPALLVSNREN
jgi:hypothetical protein